MRCTKLWSAVLVLPVLVLLGCGDDSNPTQPPAPSPVGNWAYSGTFNYEGTDLALVALCAIASNNTYQATGHITNGTTTITVAQEQGTWSISGNNVTLSPSSCMEYDESTQELESVTCSGPSSFVLNGTTLTDGTITMVKQ